LGNTDLLKDGVIDVEVAEVVHGNKVPLTQAEGRPLRGVTEELQRIA
jgi:hypothetical protein